MISSLLAAGSFAVVVDETQGSERKEKEAGNFSENYVSHISALVEKYRDVASEVADNIWEHAELAGKEFKSLQEFVDVLTNEGIEVKTGIGGVPTSFSASYGTGGPVVALLAEYDCVSGISQKADVFEKTVYEGHTDGHGCGHNLLGSGCLEAFLALRDYIDETGIHGTVVLFGCPAEESGGGKTFMARAGVFDDVDIALSWHPGDWTGIVASNLQADVWMRYTFTGKSSHAASAPEMGRSALDSVEIMNIGANYLREHVSSDVCFHYSITDTGGISPNVVQSHASVEYLIRAANLKTANEVRERIDNIARGSALINGTSVDIEFVTGCSQYEANSQVGYQVYNSMQQLGDPYFSEEEREYAKKFAETFDFKGATNTVRPLINALVANNPEKEYLFTSSLNDSVFIYVPCSTVSPGTSDVGDVSQKCPTIMFMTTCWAQGTSGHSWQSTAQGKSSLAHSGMTYAAKVMALTVLNYFRNSELIQSALDEFKNSHLDSYVSPMPAEMEFGQN